MVEYIDSQALLKENISGFRKGHSTTTVLLNIRDDVLRAMKRGEVTLMVLADFSKAFDTIKYKTVLTKLSQLGFSNDYLKWTVNYLTGRRHFVQIDDKTSGLCPVNFGVPQGSILGPLIFNLHVADLQSYVEGKCHQYADDTTLYAHCKPENVQDAVADMQSSVRKLEEWSSEANLIINPSKTKVMMLSTAQLSSSHSLYDASIDIEINGTPMERVNSTKLLGSYIHEHLKWEENVKNVASTCYSTLATLRKLKNSLPLNIRKNLVQSLVLSKLYYNDVIHHSLPQYLDKRLQRVQKAAASFVLGKYARTADVLSLNWLPIKGQREWNTLKVTYKVLHDANWPNYLKLQLVNHSRVLRSSSGSQIQVPLIKNILQDQSANLYNDLSIEIRNCNDYKVFCKETKNFLVLKAWSRLD